MIYIHLLWSSFHWNEPPQTQNKFLGFNDRNRELLYRAQCMLCLRLSIPCFLYLCGPLFEIPILCATDHVCNRLIAFVTRSSRRNNNKLNQLLAKSTGVSTLGVPLEYGWAGTRLSHSFFSSRIRMTNCLAIMFVIWWSM